MTTIANYTALGTYAYTPRKRTDFCTRSFDYRRRRTRNVLLEFGRHNGNISEQLYNKGAAGMKFVTYNYDNLNRLTAGNSQEAISENTISYDPMGNIQGLTRYGQNAGTLTYSYYSNSNQLQSVSSNNGSVSRTYGAYDANGNAPSDGMGHTISYNMLNLPRSISSGISYVYDATGQKLSRTFNGTTTYYVSGIQYTGSSIDFAQTEEGRVLNLTGTPNYEYTLTDHLGNNRVSFDQVTGKVGEEDYYPFGLNVDRQVNAGNKYLYNKKEIQDGLNGQLDYGARFYDPVIGRWTNVDPLVEDGQETGTPYGYVYDDPIKYTDPDGRVPGIGALSTADRAWAAFVEVFSGSAEAAEVVEGGTGGTGSHVAAGILAAGTVAAAGAYVNEFLPKHSASGSHSASGRTTATRDNVPDAIKPNPMLQAKKADNGLKRDDKHIEKGHVDRNAKPDKSKYRKPNQAPKLEKRTINDPDRQTTQEDGRERYEKDYGREIGTDGETSHRVIVDPKKGEIVTSFPQQKPATTNNNQ